MSHIRVAIAGASGRMGKQLIQAANQSAAVRLSVVIVRPGSVFTGCDAGELAGCGLVGVTVADNLQTVADQFDVLIDFTRPEATPGYLAFCQQYKKGMVIGTTGFDQAGKAAIRQAAKSISVVFAANFSVGVNLMLNLLRQASRVMGHYADIEIVEAHHRHKVDAPSGTALAMGETIADTMGWRLDKHAVYAREGHTGERRAESIGFATIRAGNIVGEHTAIFADMGEQVEITHKAYDRMTFAKGAVLAASWLKGRNCGLFSMSDVLGF